MCQDSSWCRPTRGSHGRWRLLRAPRGRRKPTHGNVIRARVILRIELDSGGLLFRASVVAVRMTAAANVVSSESDRVIPLLLSGLFGFRSPDPAPRIAERDTSTTLSDDEFSWEFESAQFLLVLPLLHRARRRRSHAEHAETQRSPRRLLMPFPAARASREQTVTRFTEASNTGSSVVCICESRDCLALAVGRPCREGHEQPLLTSSPRPLRSLRELVVTRHRPSPDRIG